MSTKQQAGRSILIGLLFPTLFGLLSPVFVEAKVFIEYLAPANQKLLFEDVTEKSGLKLGVNEKSRLYVKNDQIDEEKGSALLRKFLRSVLRDEKNRFFLRDRSGHTQTVFGYTDAGTNEIHSGNTRYIVDIDFSDLKNSKRYSSDAGIAAFSPALILFHEIDHKVSYDPDEPIIEGVRDDHSQKGIAGVIERTNRVRKELDLPLRVVTNPLLKKYRGPIVSFKNTIEIPFEKPDGAKVYLRFKPTR